MLFVSLEVLLLHPSERSSDWYSSKIHKASPFIAYFSKELCDIHIFSSPDVKELTRLCFWLHQQSAVLSCFELLLQKNSEENNLSYHECLLLITAMLERGLGNVRYMAWFSNSFSCNLSSFYSFSYM